MLLCAVFGVVQAQQVSLDFSTNDWGLPEGSANKLTESKPYTNSDGYTTEEIAELKAAYEAN